MISGRKNTPNKNDWNTPPKYIKLINKFFDNNIELDPCSNEFSMVQSKVKYILPLDGLKETWKYKTIFVNPPYGRNVDKTTIYDWLKKGIRVKSEILYLIPVATNTKHFKDLIFKNACGICFLEDTRLKFWSNGIEYKKGSPMACCFVYFGCNYDKFYNVFNNNGKCFKL